ncbi:MAG: nitroreductase family protein [Alphaproteobacteria bacterium]|nr:nitroreductase family protein [Alphaproteobacteria bacterium]
MDDDRAALAAHLAARFGAAPALPDDLPGAATLARMANHRTIRAYAPRPVAPELLHVLSAVALSAPTKSDLQQADIVLVADAGQRAALAALLPDNPWAAKAPAFAVFCGNNRRQRRLHELRGHDFVNDHLDAFFNAAVDAAIVLSAFITAAEATGLTTTPISAIRNHAQAVSDILALPAYVFPVAGLCIGWPAHPGSISPRLPLATTVHVDRHADSDFDTEVAEYDARRDLTRPYRERRRDDVFGADVAYGWSEDKARQYAQPERQGWGGYVRARGFRLD